MAPSRPWLKENWFSLVQTLGIAAGILFTALTLRQDLHERRVSDYLALASQHRELWSQLQGNPRLSRLLAPDRNLVREPVTRDERLFLELTFTHFHTGWLLAREVRHDPCRFWRRMPELLADYRHPGMSGSPCARFINRNSPPLLAQRFAPVPWRTSNLALALLLPTDDDGHGEDGEGADGSGPIPVSAGQQGIVGTMQGGNRQEPETVTGHREKSHQSSGNDSTATVLMHPWDPTQNTNRIT